eukprot:5458301-Pleurochrysis_carterae.AAC.1
MRHPTTISPLITSNPRKERRSSWDFFRTALAGPGTTMTCADSLPRPKHGGVATSQAPLMCRLHRRLQRARPLVRASDSVRSSLAEVPPAFRVPHPIQTSALPQLPQSEPSPAVGKISTVHRYGRGATSVLRVSA